jgi:hypothetical protein
MRRTLDKIRTGIALVQALGSLAAWAFVSPKK